MKHVPQIRRNRATLHYVINTPGQQRVNNNIRTIDIFRSSFLRPGENGHGRF